MTYGNSSWSFRRVAVQANGPYCRMLSGTDELVDPEPFNVRKVPHANHIAVGEAGGEGRNGHQLEEVVTDLKAESSSDSNGG